MSDIQADLRRALVVFRENPTASEEEFLAALGAAGIERRMAVAIIEFMPVAFTRVEFRYSGAMFCDHFIRQAANGDFSQPFLYSGQPVFLAAVALAEAGVARDDMLAVLTRSAEFDMIRQVLDSGKTLSDGVFSPLIFMWNQADAEATLSPAPRKWWQFWKRK
ncbi:MAG: hypothetical protein AMXMBFR47_32180 [Planctomycetota bacterium]